MKTLRLYAVSAAITLLAPVVNAADLDAVMQKCNDCHGDDGVSQWNDVPTIAGIDEFVHSDALFIYRDKERPCADHAYNQGDTSRPETNMCSVTEGLSDEDIEEIAAAYSELPYVRATQDFDASLAAAGEAVHNERCDKCHSDGGTNVEDEASMLGGQQMGYLESTFAQFAAGEREQPAKMKDVMDPLSDDDVQALLHYYASQQ